MVFTRTLTLEVDLGDTPSPTTVQPELSTSPATITLSEKPTPTTEDPLKGPSTSVEGKPGTVTRIITIETTITRTRTRTVPANTEPISTSLPENSETATPTESVLGESTVSSTTTVPAKSASVSFTFIGPGPIPTDPGNKEPTTTTSFPPPTKTVDPDVLVDSIKRAIKLNKDFAKRETGKRCDPRVLLACQGTAGREIIQCENGTYQSAYKCGRNANCYAVPQELSSGTLVACLTPEDAAARFDMSVDEFNSKSRILRASGTTRRKRGARDDQGRDVSTISVSPAPYHALPIADNDRVYGDDSADSTGIEGGEISVASANGGGEGCGGGGMDGDWVGEVRE
ncbi:hypothetical protein BDZ91DRAFT_787904 [Kalaharituber pfeilii]|nr:hypothetical protein BDZ91DRAFT_787904 [Kalaharituber pfeilii]